MSSHSKPTGNSGKLQVPEIFTLDEQKQMALTWIDREIREGKSPNRKDIAKACNIAYSTIQDTSNGRHDRKTTAHQLSSLTVGEERRFWTGAVC